LNQSFLIKAVYCELGAPLFFSPAIKVYIDLCLTEIISYRLLDAEIFLLVILKMNLTEIIVAFITMPI